MKNLLWFYNIFHVKTIFYVEGLRVNLLSMSQICDQDFMVLSSKGKCFVMDESGKKLISGVWTLDTIIDWFLMLILCAIAFVCQINGWDMLVTNIFLLYLNINQSWGYQSLIEWAMWCVDHVSLGNRRKLSIQALRHQLHLGHWSFYIWILWVQLESSLLVVRDTSWLW